MLLQLAALASSAAPLLLLLLIGLPLGASAATRATTATATGSLSALGPLVRRRLLLAGPALRYVQEEASDARSPSL